MDYFSIALMITISVVAIYFGLMLIVKYRYSQIKYSKTTKIDDKVVVITGGNSGIGKETAIDLARRGGKVYIACRDASRAEKALKDIKRLSGSENVHFLQLDLASMESIHEFVEKFHQLETKLDILICNAGIMMTPEGKTKDGFELQLGTNHLGHLLLTNLLLDLIKAAAPSRIVVVAAEAHRFGRLHRDNLMLINAYGPIKAYAQSKLANILFANELARMLQGTGVAVNSLHPGIIITTELGRHLLHPFIRDVLVPFFRPFFMTPVQGAQTQIKCALDPELDQVTGKYFKDCELATPNSDAQNEDLGKWLWDASVKLVELDA